MASERNSTKQPNVLIKHSELSDTINKLNVTDITEKKKFNIYILKTNNGIIKIKSYLEPKEFYASLNIKKK